MSTLLGGPAAPRVARDDPRAVANRASYELNLWWRVTHTATWLADVERTLAAVNKRLDDPALIAAYPDGSPERRAALDRYHALVFAHRNLVRDVHEQAKQADKLWKTMTRPEREATAEKWGTQADGELMVAVYGLAAEIAPWRGFVDKLRPPADETGWALT